jgi:SAM-dependent methyltransferase
MTHDHDHHQHGHDHAGHDHAGHDHAGHDHQHGHGHAHDQGWQGFLRYARRLPRMWRSPVSEAIVAEVAPTTGDLVVDLGCGMGPATTVAVRSGAFVLAVDPTPYMRRIVGLRTVLRRRRVRVEAGAAEAIPAADGSVQALWTVNTIHHWGDQRAAAAEIARVLAPGGRVLLVDEDFDDPSHPWFHEMRERRAAHAHHFDDVDPVALADLLVAAGFVEAHGGSERIAGRPAKVVRAQR